MTKNPHSIGTLLLLIGNLALIPSARAYVTPEQMLEGAAFQNYVPSDAPEYPIAAEHVQEQKEDGRPSGIRPRTFDVKYRAQPSRGPHMTLKQYLSAAEAEMETEEETQENNDGMLTIPTGNGGEDGVTLKIDQRTARILERLTKPRQQILTLQAGVQETHSGAPLAPTGPATVAAMGAMLAAIYGTVRRAGKAFTRS